jgi:hypothetical protein
MALEEDWEMHCSWTHQTSIEHLEFNNGVEMSYL